MRVESTSIYRSCDYAAVARAAARSPSGRAATASGNEGTSGESSGGAVSESNADGDTVEISAEGNQASLGQLDSEEQQVVAQLKTIDQQIRSHEMAHLAAAGPYARGGASYTYTKGPDGVDYAVAGEVSIDASPEPGDPEATIRKAEVVHAAALAPANPSTQDRQVAAAATKMEAEARQELAVEEAASLAGLSCDAPACQG